MLELGIGERGCGYDGTATAERADALRVELVDADEVVESSGISTTSHICRVASGAKDTLRFAVEVSLASLHISQLSEVSTDRGSLGL